MQVLLILMRNLASETKGLLLHFQCTCGNCSRHQREALLRGRSNTFGLERVHLLKFNKDYESEKWTYEDSNSQDKSYELPDGNIVTLGKERIQCAEALFQPSLIGSEVYGLVDL